MTTFRLIHLSDFHFNVPSGTHDERLLRGIEQSLSTRDFDRLVVSGDVTDRGDELSLERAKTWLLDEISLSNGQKSGLRLGDFSKLRVIPGNHDAYAAGTSLRVKFWQDSVHEFYAKFDDDPTLRRDGVSFEWLQKGPDALFIAYVDSCYLGGANTMARLRSFLARTARGKVSVKQTQRLLTLHDRACRGELTDRNGVQIPADLYRRSLKIVVMHHFLVAPKAKKVLTKINMATCMKLNQRRRAFANLVLADFSLLLCGHSHLGTIREIPIGAQLGRRGSARHLLNKLRRELLLPTEPLRSSDTIYGWKESMLARLLFRTQPGPVDLRDFLQLLDQLLRGNTDLQRQLMEHVAHDDGLRKEITDDEVRLVCSAIESLGTTKRKELRKLANEVFGFAQRLASARFLQAMNGSSTKTWEATKRRTFFEYDIRRTKGGWEIEITRHEYRHPEGFVAAKARRYYALS